jgi:HPr kinase/phosphorylase
LPAPPPTEDGQRSVTLHDLLESRGTVLQLENLTPDTGLDRPITEAEISSPGLALAGWTGRFAEGRMLVFGETEMTYLGELDESGARSRLTGIFRFDVPAVFVTKGQHVPSLFLQLATEARVPVLLSRLTTKEFYRRIKPYLEAVLAPVMTLHGSLADVYGVGLLFMGKSGVGKSECVLDLVERGHRLVADDLVFASRHGADILIGKGHELQRHHMEIRGVGIIDVRALFGIRATRLQKRIEVVVHLERWDADRDYSRTGLDQDETEIHGVMLPRVTVPLNPGKNITVISEVIAMNRLLRYAGVDSAAIFDQRIRDNIRPFEEYLEWDQE